MGQMMGLARLGRDAEVRYTGGGDAVAGLSLAMDYRDKKEKATQWVEGSLWGKQAESLAEYLTKGKLVFVVLDDVHIEEYEGKNGIGHKLVGRVSKIDLAGGGEGGQREQSTQRQQAEPRKQASKPAPNKTGFDDMDDDLPF